MIATTLLGAVVIGTLLVADFASETAGRGTPHRCFPHLRRLCSRDPGRRECGLPGEPSMERGGLIAASCIVPRKRAGGDDMTAAATRTDQRGNPLSTSSDTAVEAYNRGLDLFFSGNPGADKAFQEAIDADEGFALARVALARTMVRTDPKLGRKLLDAARELGAGTTKHEQRHIATLAEADPNVALGLAVEHLSESPNDAEVLMAAHFMRFQGGQPKRAPANFEMVERYAGAYAEDDWWYLALRAFVNHEVFRLEESRGYAQRSLELMPMGYTAAHAMAHVDEESDQAAQGDAFLDGWLRGKSPQALLYGHLNWHQALFKLWRQVKCQCHVHPPKQLTTMSDDILLALLSGF